LTWTGAAGRFPGGISEKVRRQIEHELELIGRLKYEAYFLTVYDVVSFARSRGILVRGEDRRPTAPSAIAWA